MIALRICDNCARKPVSAVCVPGLSLYDVHDLSRHYDVYRVRPCIASARCRSRFSRVSLEGMALTSIVVRDRFPRESCERASCGELSQAHDGLDMVIMASAHLRLVHLARKVSAMPRVGRPGWRRPAIFLPISISPALVRTLTLLIHRTMKSSCSCKYPDMSIYISCVRSVILLYIVSYPAQGYCEGVVGNFHGDAVRFHGRLKKPVLTKRGSAASPISRPSSSQSAFTVSARDAPSPAVLSVREAFSPVALSPRDSWSPLVMRDVPPPQASALQIEPSVSSSSSMSFSAASQSPLASPNPERSMSHESQATSLSSAPITPADDSADGASIARTADASDTESLVPPIRLEDIAKQLSSDSPVEHFYSPSPTTSRFPPGDRDSVYSDDEPNPRISIASSDNGGVNIGLSLLGDGGDDSDDSDAESFSAIRRVQSPESTFSLRVPMTAGSESQYSESPRSTTQFARVASPDSTVEGPFEPPSARSESHYSASPPASQALDLPPTARSERSESNYSGSPVSTRAPLPPGEGIVRPESEYDFSEDWEGADDIYDQYRYSRFSMASKMSRMSRRTCMLPSRQNIFLCALRRRRVASWCGSLSISRKDRVAQDAIGPAYTTRGYTAQWDAAEAGLWAGTRMQAADSRSHGGLTQYGRAKSVHSSSSVQSDT